MSRYAKRTTKPRKSFVINENVEVEAIFGDDLSELLRGYESAWQVRPSFLD